MAERHVAELIGAFFARAGMLRALRRAEAVVVWPQVAGPKVARFSWARALKGGVLFVDVADSETAMHMALERPRLIEAYARVLGRQEVRDIRFVAGRRHAEVEEVGKVVGDGGSAVPVDEGAWQSLLTSIGELELPEPLAEEAVRAGRAMLEHRVRAQAAGWTACEHCGALSPNVGACDVCRRYRDTLSVRRVAERWIVDPAEPAAGLSEEERRVAVGLAVEALDARVRALLAEVLVAPERLPELDASARNRVALADGVAASEVTDEDVERYDARVARALGRWTVTKEEKR